MSKNSKLVYSTEHGRMCSQCARPVADCQCQILKKQRVLNAEGTVRVLHETKGRKGKGVTLIKGLSLTEEELQNLAKTLKVLCGSGGTVKDGVIEIQGEHCQSVTQALLKRGLTVKPSRN